MKTIISLSALVVALSLTGCQSPSRQDMGLIGGGVVGGVAGSALTHGSPVGAAVGAVGGAYVGHELAK